MVLFFESKVVQPPVLLYMGKDKFENEDLIRYAYAEDVWFHVDKLSSAHLYLRMPQGMTWEAIPPAVLADCAQLVKANSIEGNKKDNIAIIYTPAANLKKSGDMAIGQVSFHKEKTVRRTHVDTRINNIVNRLNKTKVEREVDHEADKAEREREAGRIRKKEALERKQKEAELAKEREALAKSKNYTSLFEAQEQDERERAMAKAAREAEEQRKAGDTYDSDDDFM